MGEKENQNKNEGEKKGNGDGKKEDKTSVLSVVLEVDMHCAGCASKIVKCVRGFEGVETVKSEAAANKLTITGAVDPVKIRDKLQEKTKKKVELISPQPKKEKENDNGNKNASKESKKDNSKKNIVDDKKSDNEKKKPKEPPVMTAVLKLNLHCHGCIEKIRRTITKTKGVQEMSMDKQKELVTVKGTMDVNALTACLTEKLKRPVEIVSPKEKEKEKEKEKKKSGDAAVNGEGKKKKESAGGGQEGIAGGGIGKMEYVAGQPGGEYGFVYPHPYGTNEYYPVQAHAPQIFSDENPNACTVM